MKLTEPLDSVLWKITDAEQPKGFSRMFAVSAFEGSALSHGNKKIIGSPLDQFMQS